MFRLLAEGGAIPPTPPPAQNNFGDTLTDGVAGPTALLIIVLLAIATVLLIRNMNGRLRRLPAKFPVPDSGTDGAPAAGSPAGGEATRPADADPSNGGTGPAEGAEASSEGAEASSEGAEASDKGGTGSAGSAAATAGGTAGESRASDESRTG